MGNGAGLAAAATDPLVETDIKAKLESLSHRELELIKHRLSALPDISREHKTDKLEDLREIAKQVRHGDLTEEEIASLEQKLNEIDSDKSGLLSLDELAALLDAVGLKLNDEEMQGKLQAAGIDRNSKIDMLKLRMMMSAPKDPETHKEPVDSEGPGPGESKRPKKLARLATTADLLAVAQEAKSNLNAEDVSCLEESFKSIDTDTDGYISPEELRIALEAINVVMSEAEVLDIFALVDVDGNKQLDSEEYKTFVAMSQM
jgi:calcium-dependent protein kinase